jgi:hypothetical protein
MTEKKTFFSKYSSYPSLSFARILIVLLVPLVIYSISQILSRQEFVSILDTKINQFQSDLLGIKDDSKELSDEEKINLDMKKKAKTRELERVKELKTLTNSLMAIGANMSEHRISIFRNRLYEPMINEEKIDETNRKLALAILKLKKERKKNEEELNKYVNIDEGAEDTYNSIRKYMSRFIRGDFYEKTQEERVMPKLDESYFWKEYHGLSDDDVNLKIDYLDKKIAGVDEQINGFELKASIEIEKYQDNITKLNRKKLSSTTLNNPSTKASSSLTYWSNPLTLPDWLCGLNNLFLQSIIVISCGAIGTFLSRLRLNRPIELNNILLGFGAGFITFLVLNGGKHIFLLKASGVAISFNPYNTAFAGILAGLFTEDAYELLRGIVDDFKGRFENKQQTPEKK